MKKNNKILNNNIYYEKKGKYKFNLLWFYLYVCVGVILPFSSCSPILSEKLKADVIGFNNDVTKSYRKKSAPYNLLDLSQKKAMNTFVMKLPQGQNTAAYYALDLGLDRVKYVRKKRKIMGKDPNSKYYIIMLTDGLDNISTQVAKNNKQGNYATGDDYAKALQKKMSKVMGKGTNEFQAYSLLYIGDDLKQIKDQNNLTDIEFETFLDNKLSIFTGSSPNTTRPKVIIGDNFDSMLEDFSNQFKTASFDFVIPKDYVGKRVRMTLENEKGEDAYLEGDFIKNRKSYKFDNIQYSNGFGSDINAGGTIFMKETKDRKDKKSILTKFSINNLKLNDNPYKVEFVGQSVKDSGIWAINSEYNAQSETMKNAYIMVILDGSLSFASQYENAQEMILNIVKEITK